jgi:hypothetical protein
MYTIFAGLLGEKSEILITTARGKVILRGRRINLVRGAKTKEFFSWMKIQVFRILPILIRALFRRI